MKSAETDHVPTMYFSVHGFQFQYTAVHPGPSACDVNNPGITVPNSLMKLAILILCKTKQKRARIQVENTIKCNKKSSVG